MSDLSQRLRECAETEYDCDQFSPETVSAIEEAADEIARLVYAWEGQMEKMQAEIDRLRAENDALWNIADAVRFIKDRVPSWINDEIDELHRRRNAMRMVAPAPPGKEE